MIRGIHHFSFTVSNIEDTIRFFRDLLGLKATPIMDVEDERLGKIVKMPGAVLRVSMVSTPDDGNIELIEYMVPKGDKIDLKTCNVGVAHLAFVVDDVQRMYDDLTVKGVEFNHPPIWIEETGLGVCYLKGPDGITLELIQTRKDK